MKILFANEALKKECNNQEMLIKRLGPYRAKLLRQRLDELFSADVLADIRSLPHVGISVPPPGGTDLALDLGHPCRLMFRPAGLPPGDGVWDWNKIDSIIILALRGTDA
jgi:proteic killer suppression protein